MTRLSASLTQPFNSFGLNSPNTNSSYWWQSFFSPPISFEPPSCALFCCGTQFCLLQCPWKVLGHWHCASAITAEWMEITDNVLSHRVHAKAPANFILDFKQKVDAAGLIMIKCRRRAFPLVSVIYSTLFHANRYQKADPITDVSLLHPPGRRTAQCMQVRCAITPHLLKAGELQKYNKHKSSTHLHRQHLAYFHSTSPQSRQVVHKLLFGPHHISWEN